MNKRNKLVKQYKQLKQKYAQLQEEYDEARGYLGSYLQHARRQEELIRCQHNYIHWKALDNEFALFQEYAHEEDFDIDFPYLMM